MCLRPISIPNPNYGKVCYFSQFGTGVEIPRHLLPKDKFIKVPCGKCAECKQSFYNSVLQRALVEARTSYMYFVTLTYDNKHIPIIKLPSGEELYYFNYKHIQDMFKRFRNNKHLDRDFRYLCVNEYGDTYSRPHAHLLIFVAKLDTDNVSSPYFIQDILFRNLKTYFSINIGTKKNPTYECLFTYRKRGKFSNYFVKYVDPFDQHKYNNHDVDSAYIKTIRYLISYVNCGSRFDKIIESIINTYDDPILVRKLRYLLTSRVRYSKGFGCGFMDGKKHYMPIISHRVSSNTLYLSDLYYNLPKTFAEYVSIYDNIESLNKFISNFLLQGNATIDEYLCTLNAQDYYFFSILCIYFPYFVNSIYRRCFTNNLTPTISYLFYYLHPTQYRRLHIKSHLPLVSPTFNYLRSNVEKGIQNKIPYLTYVNESDGTFTSLCSFYKKRITTVNDLINLFNNCNFHSYEDWLNSFIEYKNLSKVAKNVGNITKHAESTEIILPSQKKYLNLHPAMQGFDLYTSLFA